MKDWTYELEEMIENEINLILEEEHETC